MSTDNYCGFFPVLNGAEINDLTLDNVRITSGKTYSGAFTSWVYGDDVSITNCHITGESQVTRLASVSSFTTVVAGFAAVVSGGTLNVNSSTIGADTTLTGDFAAGFVGYANGADTKFTDCTNSGSISDEGLNGYYDVNYVGMGGIIGYSDQSSTTEINRCANHGTIDSNNDGSTGIGGIAGACFNSLIINCYNTADLSCRDVPGIGGIAGVIRADDDSEGMPNHIGMVLNCYNVGDITAIDMDSYSSIGGVVGSLTCDERVTNNVVIKNAYSFSELTGDGVIGTIIGDIYYSAVDHSYGADNTDLIGTILEGDTANNVGFFSSATTDGYIIPAEIKLENNVVTVTRSEALSKNLLTILNDWVNEQNEAAGEQKYLSWKMTNPASEDGSKGVTVHPMFGVLVEQTLNFHVNEPNAADRLFRVYNGDASEAEDTTEYTFTNGTVEAFYDIPSFAGDDYVFAGWYYDADGDEDGDIPFEFDATLPANLTDVSAHWIEVGEVAKADGDEGNVSGFALQGVQIRPEAQFDQNLGEYYYGGLRFVTSISESLLSSVDALSNQTVNGNKVEYGYVTASMDIVNTVTDDDRFCTDKSKYKIQYKGENVNGVDTLLENKTSAQRQTPNNFRYVTNVDCTSKMGNYGGNARIKIDHQNYTHYRLATFVVTYQDKAEDMTKNVVARAYMRYYDANGLLRTFYNDYDGTNVYGGCSTSYNDAYTLAGI